MRLRSLLSVFILCALLLPSFAIAEEVAHAEGAGAGVPQLDTTYYASQFFWLLVTGFLLYVLMSKFALPGVSRMINMRDSKVRADLELAYKLKQQAEDLKIAYSKALRDSDEKSKTLMEKTIREMREKQAKGLTDATNRIASKIKDAEKQLRSQHDSLMLESSVMSEQLAATVLQELSRGSAR